MSSAIRIPASRSGRSSAPVEGSPQPSSGEDRLIDRVRGGDNAAFEELVRATGDRLLAVARRMLRREEDAQDAVQEAFLSAFRSFDRFDGRSKLSTWLHRITVNACLMKLRATRRRPEVSIEGLLPQFVDDGHQTTPARPWRSDPLSRPEGEELRALVRAKIEELPGPFREVLLLRDILEIDTEQTAGILGLGSGAVKTRLHRARQALRTLLDPHMSETAAD